MPAGAPALALRDGAVSIGSGSPPRAGADVWLVRYDPRTLDVSVKAQVVNLMLELQARMGLA